MKKQRFLLRKSIANVIKTLKISERDFWDGGMLSNISNFIALLKGTTLKEMFKVFM